MSGRCGVEDHVIELSRGVILAQQLCELIEGCDLDGTGARQLLLDALHSSVGQKSAVRTDKPLAGFLRRFFWIAIHGEETWNALDRNWMYSKTCCEHFVEIRSRIGAHQENTFP